MKKDKLPFLKSESFRNVSILLSGNIIGQVIAFLAMILLARIYTDADFGVFALFMSITTILSYIGTGKYEEAIVLAKSKCEATTLVGYIFKRHALFCLLIFLILLFFRKPVFELCGVESLNESWIFLPCMVFVIGAFLALNNLANREKRFKAIAGANLTQSAFSALSKIAINPLLNGSLGLLTGQLLSYVVAGFPFYSLRKDIRASFLHKWKETQAVVQKHKAFPKFNMPRSLFASVSTNLPFLVLTGIFGEAKLGLFFMAFNISFRPINLLVSSIYKVYFEKAVSLRKEGRKITPLVYSYWKRNLLFVLPVFVLLYWFAPQIFGFVFGEEWRESAIYLRFMLPWRFMMLFNYPMDFVPLIFNRQRFYFHSEIVVFIARVLAIFAGVYLNSFEASILFYSAVNFLYITFIATWYNTVLRKEESGLIP
ncbi:oligosaccharide flippase family protein [Bacteroidales bacterium OttesenSCG-928-L03]|nr:oligosaccharide flippase family protein [Bacteroidales bacterium OttesenSCG-928-L03]